MKIIFKQSYLIIALSIGLQIQSGNVNAFGLSDVSGAVDQVNSVAKQLNVPQPIPTTPTPTPTVTTTTLTEVPAEFQGKWVENTSTCIGNPADVMGLDISKDGISYGTSWGGKIKSIKSISQGVSLEVVSEDCEDGNCQINTRKLSLSNSAGLLSVSNSAGVVEKYSHCVSASSEVVTPITSASEGKVLFSCKAKKGKEIRLVDKGSTIEYSFGMPNKKSDILVSVLREKATTNYEIHEDYELEKFGQGSFFSVDVPNGNTRYRIYFQYGYPKDHLADEGGVSVIINNKYTNEVKCVGKEIINNLQNVDLKVTSD